MLQQASRDIQREVGAGVRAAQGIIAAAAYDPQILAELAQSNARHVELEIIDGVAQLQSRLNEEAAPPERDVPPWFESLIPGIESLGNTQHVRFLPDGRALRLRADPSDELAEVWESVGDVVLLFLLSAVLSNVAIWLGVRQGMRPVAHFLAALDAIQKGNYTARLKNYRIGEVNELADHFNRMADAVERSELENRRLSRALMEVREQERAYLARELHDDLGQYLTGIQAQAFLVSSAPDRADKVARVAEQISTNCEAMQKSFRRLVRDLHPVMLEQLGLIEAIRSYVEDWARTNGIQVEAHLDADLPAFPDGYGIHLYRIVQEALNNVARHAGADRVSLELTWGEAGLELDLCDNGRGPGTAMGSASGMGIRSMQERARCLDGSLVVENGPESGTCVRLRGACRTAAHPGA